MPQDAESGWMLHELRATIAYEGLGGELRYCRTPSGSEVDFVWTHGKRAVGIEVKAASQWRREFGGLLKSFIDDGIVQSGYGVYRGQPSSKTASCEPCRSKSSLRS
jgi:hypothetical protein